MRSKWISFGSALNNEVYIRKLLNKYNIDNYRFSVNGYGDYDLYLIVGLDTYKVSVDECNEKLLIYKKSVYRKAQKRQKEYFILQKEIGGLDCWFNTIKLISNHLY